MPTPSPSALTPSQSQIVLSAATCYGCHLPWNFLCCILHRFHWFRFYNNFDARQNEMHTVDWERGVNRWTNKQTTAFIIAIIASCCRCYCNVSNWMNGHLILVEKGGKICMCAAQPSWLCVNGMHLWCIEYNSILLTTTLSSSLNCLCHQSSIMDLSIYVCHRIHPRLIFHSCK